LKRIAQDPYDLAIQGSLPKTARALHEISQPAGQHNQSHVA
jgi:hypothetical protein